MANLILPSRRITQPSAFAGIDYTNPYSHAVTFAFNGVLGAIDVVSKEVLPVTGNITYEYDGVVTASGGKIRATSEANVTNNSNFSIVAVVRPISIGGSHQMIFSSISDVTYLDLIGDKPSFRPRVTNTVLSSPIGISAGIASTLIVVITGNTNLKLYVNGELVLNETISTMSAANGNYYIGDDFGLPFNGSILSVYTLNTTLDANDAANISDNPWQIFAPQKRIIYFDAGAGGGTVSISSSALSVATATGELSTSLNISGSSASIASIAGTPTLTINLSASALAQSLASGLLSQGVSVSGDMSAQSTVSGNVSQDVFIEGSATGQSAASGQIGLQINLAGSSISEAFASGVISGGSVSSISGAASGIASASGAVGLNIPIAGNASAQSNISGSVGVNIPVSGVSASVSSITGALTIDGLIYIDGSALSNAQSSGLISLTIPLSGAALAIAYASGVAMPDAISADYACLHGAVSRLTMIETSANHLTNLTTRVNYVARC